MLYFDFLILDNKSFIPFECNLWVRCNFSYLFHRRYFYRFDPKNIDWNRCLYHNLPKIELNRNMNKNSSLNHFHWDKFSLANTYLRITSNISFHSSVPKAKTKRGQPFVLPAQDPALHPKDNDLHCEPLSFSIIGYFLRNPSRILSVLACNGRNHWTSMLEGSCQELTENDEL